MNIEVNTASAKKALTACSVAAKGRTTLPILNNVLIEAAEGKIKFSMTDLEKAVSYIVNGEIKEEGSCTIPFELFGKWINCVTGETTSINIVKDVAKCKSDKSLVSFVTLPAEEYPGFPVVTAEGKDICMISFRDAIKKTLTAVAKNMSMPMLTGVCLSGKDIVATDKNRLHWSTVEFDICDDDVIIPIAAATSIASFLGDVATVRTTPNLFSIENDSMVFVSRVISGDFPPYQKIKGREASGSVTVNKEDLTSCLKRIAVVSDAEEAARINVNWGAGTISAESSGVGSADEKFDISKTDGNVGEMSLRRTYLMDAISACEDDSITVQFVENGRQINVLSTGFLGMISPIVSSPQPVAVAVAKAA